MLTIADISSRLNQIGEELNTKDTLIVMMNDVINTINKLIYEPTFVCSSIYPELKVKYISQLEPKIEKIKNIINKSNITPIYIPRSPKADNINTSETTTKPKKKKPQIITSEVNAPLEVDIYKNPKYKPKIVKSTKIKIDIKKDIKLPEHFFKYNNEKYYIDFNNNKVYDENSNKIGYLSIDNLYIKDKIIKLNSVSNFSGTLINDNYGYLN